MKGYDSAYKELVLFLYSNWDYYPNFSIRKIHEYKISEKDKEDLNNFLQKRLENKYCSWEIAIENLYCDK